MYKLKKQNKRRLCNTKWIHVDEQMIGCIKRVMNEWIKTWRQQMKLNKWPINAWMSGLIDEQIDQRLVEIYLIFLWKVTSEGT